MFQMYPKHITNGTVESYKNLYHSRPIPVINSSIVPSNKAKTHMLKVLAFQEMFGNFLQPWWLPLSTTSRILILETLQLIFITFKSVQIV